MTMPEIAIRLADDDGVRRVLGAYRRVGEDPLEDVACLAARRIPVDLALEQAGVVRA
jgi:hypothetical protein